MHHDIVRRAGPLALSLTLTLAACGGESPTDAGTTPMMFPPPPPPMGDGGGMMPPPMGDGGMMPPPTGDGGTMPPPTSDGGAMTPRVCATAADCAGACPMATMGCTCAATPMGMACIPSCARDADCPMGPMGQLTCNVAMRVCVPR